MCGVNDVERTHLCTLKKGKDQVYTLTTGVFSMYVCNNRINKSYLHHKNILCIVCAMWLSINKKNTMVKNKVEENHTVERKLHRKKKSFI